MWLFKKCLLSSKGIEPLDYNPYGIVASLFSEPNHLVSNLDMKSFTFYTFIIITTRYCYPVIITASLFRTRKR